MVARLGRPRSSRSRCRWFGGELRRISSRRSRLGKGSTHSDKRDPKSWWLELRRLYQVSAPYACVCLVLRHKKRQVRLQLRKFPRLVGFRVAVGVGLVQRAPLGRRVASSVPLALRLRPLGTTLLHQVRAVAFEMAVVIALVELISARRSRRHRCSTPRCRRCRRFPRLLIDEVV